MRKELEAGFYTVLCVFLENDTKEMIFMELNESDLKDDKRIKLITLESIPFT